MVLDSSGQRGSTARIRLLPTTHCEYVQPSAITAHTCGREAVVSRSTVRELSTSFGCVIDAPSSHNRANAM